MLAMCWRRQKRRILAFKTVQETSDTNEQHPRVERKSWEIDPKQLVINCTIGFGNSGVVYKGDYDGSVVAIKKLKAKIADVLKVVKSKV
eukprot:m.218586 g.218586  ORF g.218586 m.218586 type:complete len:89 (+) comp39900_c1_seq9:3795-4061(+)